VNLLNNLCRQERDLRAREREIETVSEKITECWGVVLTSNKRQTINAC